MNRLSCESGKNRVGDHPEEPKPKTTEEAKSIALLASG